MKSILTDSSTSLIIQEHTCCQIENLQVEILSHLGQFADIHYFQVIIYNADVETKPTKEVSGRLGLLRVGSVDGGLNRELQLRSSVGNYNMVSELLAAVTEESVFISFPQFVTATDSDELADKSDQETEYLEEEFYPEQEVSSELSPHKLLLLSYLPNTDETLENWLTQSHSLKYSLLLACQVCQFFRHLHQQQWSIVQILPQFIQLGTPVKFFDLTGAYPVGDRLFSSFLGKYCAPEIAYDSSCTIDEPMSAYIVGVILYQAIHQKLPTQNYDIDLEIKRIPLIYQILKLCLSPIPEERFPLSQLLSLLVESRKSILTPQIQWNVYGRSTLGLSTTRLQNEDSYGVRQQCLSNSEPILLGVVADGMGGMADGEVASKLAVQTVLEAHIPGDISSQKQRAAWLAALVQKANTCVTDNVRDGGTTLSLVAALGRDLMIAHVGDSRIFLLRKKQICQLSEDHSMVAMLVASGQITYEQSQSHPDRNVLIRSLGSKRRLSDDYIHDLSRFGSISISLEDGDTLILCSDGVWDLVAADELAEIFAGDRTLHSAVELTIGQVLARGAHDNATILALKCCIDNSY